MSEGNSWAYHSISQRYPGGAGERRGWGGGEVGRINNKIKKYLEKKKNVYKVLL